MRDRLLVPGLAMVGFAVTLAVTGWPHLGAFQLRRTALQPETPTPSTRVQTARPAQAPPATVPAAAILQQDASAKADDSDSATESAQPPLPDSAALPSYEEDQAARNADALRSARSR